MKTLLLIEMDHAKPIADKVPDLTDEVANRVYTMLHARGVKVEVTASEYSQKEKAE